MAHRIFPVACGILFLYLFFSHSMRTLSCDRWGLSSWDSCIGTTESEPLYHEGSPQKKCTLNLGWAGAKLITNNIKIFGNPHGRHTDPLEQLVSVTPDEGLGISCRGLC